MVLPSQGPITSGTSPVLIMALGQKIQDNKKQDKRVKNSFYVKAIIA